MVYRLGLSLAALVLLAGMCFAVSCASDSQQPTPTSPAASQTPATPSPPPTPEAAAVYTYEVVNTYPHNPESFTQGLVFEDGVLFEGTGLRGHSRLCRVDLDTGASLQCRELASSLFGEGVTICGDRIIQLTWQSNVGFVYDKDSFELLEEFGYATEGWGLTWDGESLIMSDGTSTLHFMDPETLGETARLEVFDENGPVTRLNELEFIAGEIYANVWQTDLIARISPDTGRVIGWVNLEGLLAPEDAPAPVDVLNGIAYDRTGDRLFVTGKLWPKLFQIRLVPGS